RPPPGALRVVPRHVLAAAERADRVLRPDPGGVAGNRAGMADRRGPWDPAGGRPVVRRVRELPAAGAVELVDRDPHAVDAGERACVAGDAPARGRDLHARRARDVGCGAAAAGPPPLGRNGRVDPGGLRPCGLLVPGVSPGAAGAARLSDPARRGLRPRARWI